MTQSNFAEHTSADATITAQTALATSIVAASGLREGQALLIIGFVEIVVGTNTSGFNLSLRQGIAANGTLEGEASSHDVSVAGAATFTVSIMAIANAFQDDPVYNLTVTQEGSGGNGTISQSGIVVIRLD